MSAAASKCAAKWGRWSFGSDRSPDPRQTHEEGAVEFKDQSSLASGILFLAVGALAGYLSMNYGLGSPQSPGAGFFPSLLSATLVLLGGIQVVGALTRPGVSHPGSGWNLTKPLAILGPVVLFAIMLKPAGMLLSVFVLVVLASLANSIWSWRYAITAAVSTAAVCAVVFVYLLKLPIPLLPSGKLWVF